MPSNEELILKTITSAQLSPGGQLNAKQERAFTQVIKRHSGLLAMTRFREMTQFSEEINRVFAGEPITTGATENTAGTEGTHDVNPQFGLIPLSAVKLRVLYNIPTEVFIENIERQQFEGTFFDIIGRQHSSDLENLFVNGDDTITGTDRLALLLAQHDGIDVRTEQAHILDAGGTTIGRDIGRDALNQLPKAYRNDPGLVFLTSTGMVNDWMEVIGNRLTTLGDRAVEGYVPTLAGKPVIGISAWPEDKQVSVTSAAQQGIGISNKFSPFKFTNAAVSGGIGGNTLRLQVVATDPSAVNVTFNCDFSGLVASGSVETPMVAQVINAAWRTAQTTYTGDIAQDHGDGRLRLTTPGTNTTSWIDILTASGAGIFDAQTMFDFPASGASPAVYAIGTAAASGITRDGTFMLLCNPMSLVWARVMNTRVYAKFNQDRDRVEVAIYTWWAAAIESYDNMVKIKNLRPATTGTASSYSPTKW